jgi:hypothetical protein
VDPRHPWPILYVPKVHGSLERRGGISLDDLRTLLGAGPIDIGTTALPDEMSVSISVEHERASVSVLATVPTEHVDTRVFPSLGYVIAHGIIFPCAQAGSTAEFPDRAGAAAGLFGALMMGVATIVGFVIGSTHDGTTVPMTLTMATCGLAVLVASRLPGLRESAAR